MTAGAAWLNGAFGKVAKAGQVAGTKTRQKWNMAMSNLTAKVSVLLSGVSLHFVSVENAQNCTMSVLVVFDCIIFSHGINFLCQLGLANFFRPCNSKTNSTYSFCFRWKSLPCKTFPINPVIFHVNQERKNTIMEKPGDGRINKAIPIDDLVLSIHTWVHHSHEKPADLLFVTEKSFNQSSV